MSGLLMKYFVLSPNKQDAYGEASRKAMKAYAAAIFEENEEMARDIIHWLKMLEPLEPLDSEVAVKTKKRKSNA